MVIELGKIPIFRKSNNVFNLKLSLILKNILKNIYLIFFKLIISF